MTDRPIISTEMTAGPTDNVRENPTRRSLPILMYHGVHSDESSPGVYNAVYSVSAAQLVRQLDWLADHGYRTTLLRDEARSSRDVVLTFDDGDASVMAVAVPALTERGMVAEFCIPSDFVGRPGRVTRADVRELADSGMGVMSHGRTHRHLSALSDSELHEELSSSRRDLEDWSGRPVVGLSAPGGRAGRRELRAALAAGYEFVLNSFPGPNRRPRPGRYLHRLSVTRSTDLQDFAQLAQWRGQSPRRLVARTVALEGAKRVLGDSRYARVRARALSR
jgi:peptidoglycan/xylan/chitin deacetylase (PgdA/CDA1 family)